MLGLELTQNRQDNGAPPEFELQLVPMGGGPIVSPQILRDIYFLELKWAMEPLVENGIP